MDERTFLDNFEHIVSAPNGVRRLQELILQLAVQGRLVEQIAGDEPASSLLKRSQEKKVRFIGEGQIRRQRAFEIQNRPSYALPVAWEWANLSMIGIINPKNDADDNIEVGFSPMAAIPDTYLDRPKYEVKKWRDIKKGFTHFANGDVVLAKITPCFENGKSAVIEGYPNGMGAGTTELHVVRLYLKDINPYYIHIFLKSPLFIRNGIASMTGLAGQKRVSREYFAGSAFPLPPKEEQNRIVKTVVKLFRLCDQLKAHRKRLAKTLRKANRAALGELINAITCSELERAWSRIDLGYESFFTLRDCINDVKETVMDLAVQGKLSRQRTDEVAAHELLKSIREERKLHGGNRSQSKPILTDVSAKYPVPSNWTTCRANELGLFITSGSRGWAKYFSSEGAWFIRIGNLSYQNTQIDPDNIQYVNPPEGSEGTRTRVEAGDILISITGDTGMVGIVPSDVQEAYINQHICLFRPSRLIDHEYLALMFRSRMGLHQLHKLQKGIKNSLSLQDVRDILINLPPRLEQTRIVTQTKRLLELCDQLKSRLSTLTLIHEKLSAGSVGFVLGMTKQVTETIRTEEKEKSFLKVPEVFLRLVAKMKKQLTETVLAKLLNQHGKSMEARELWQKSGLTIDEFYATLKREITEGFIAEPDVARLKLVEVVD